MAFMEQPELDRMLTRPLEREAVLDQDPGPRGQARREDRDEQPDDQRLLHAAQRERERHRHGHRQHEHPDEHRRGRQDTPQAAAEGGEDHTKNP